MHVWIQHSAFVCFLVGPVHCSRDPQILYPATKILKLGPTILFIYLKIILLQYF